MPASDGYTAVSDLIPKYPVCHMPPPLAVYMGDVL